MADLTREPITDDSSRNEPSQSESKSSRSSQPSTITDADIETLRQLILGDSIEKVIEKTLASPLHSAAVSRILPAALARASTEENELARAIRPTIEAAIQESVQTDEKILAEHLFPVIGPSTRKSISAAIGQLVQSLNQTLEYSVSPKSIRWRVEAFRTGKTFAEVVMIRTLAFQVEQVLLVHKETGLLLQHRVKEAVEAQDPDLVSAMLTAIEDFIRDSFSVAADRTLGTLEMGDLNLLIEEGPQSILACVVRGTAPAELRGVLRSSQEKIQRLFGPTMQSFEGDTGELDGTQPYLDDCLYFQYSERPDTESNQIGLTDRQKAIAWVIALVFTVVMGIQGFFHFQHERRWHSYLADLAQQPGLVVISQDSKRGEIVGLRDPLAINPAERLAIAHLRPEQVSMSWKPYQSLDLAFANRPSLGEMAILEVLRSRIESRLILFQPTRAVPRERYLSLIARQAEDIELLAQQASAIGKAVKVSIRAYGDRPGNALFAIALATERANYLKQAIARQGIRADTIDAKGIAFSLAATSKEGTKNTASGAVFKVDFT